MSPQIISLNQLPSSICNTESDSDTQTGKTMWEWAEVINNQETLTENPEICFLRARLKTTRLNHASFEIKVKLANFYKELETIRNDITDLKEEHNVLRQEHAWHFRGTARNQAGLECCQESREEVLMEGSGD